MVEYEQNGEQHAFILNIKPVPASRPRVTRWGTYYGKTYKEFRRQAKAALDNWVGPQLEGLLRVEVSFICHRPKTTKLLRPKGDIDNYCKAIFDALNGKMWVDDVQIASVEAHKAFADEELGEPRIVMTVTELEY